MVFAVGLLCPVSRARSWCICHSQGQGVSLGGQRVAPQGDPLTVPGSSTPLQDASATAGGTAPGRSVTDVSLSFWMCATKKGALHPGLGTSQIPLGP